MAPRTLKIVAEDGREVAHLKRVRNGSRIDVSVWYSGDMYHPTVRGRTPTTPWRLNGATRYDEREAGRWLGSLTRAGYVGFKTVTA